MQFQSNSTPHHTILNLTSRRKIRYAQKEAEVKIYEMVIVLLSYKKVMQLEHPVHASLLMRASTCNFKHEGAYNTKLL